MSSKDSFLLSSENEKNMQLMAIESVAEPCPESVAAAPRTAPPAAYLKKAKKKPLPVLELDKASKKNTPVQQFLYRPGYYLPDLSQFINMIIEVRVAKEYLNRHNKQLSRRQLWGNETYTSNSDCVCVLQHSGLYDVLAPNTHYS